MPATPRSSMWGSTDPRRRRTKRSRALPGNARAFPGGAAKSLRGHDMNVIETHELSRPFGKRAAMVTPDLESRAGEVFGFLGPNGAGKTTTIRMLTGILPPSGGTACIVGYDIRTDPDAVRARIGVPPEPTGHHG